MRMRITLLILLVRWAAASPHPKYAKEAGLLMTPLDPVYSTVSYWTHMIRQDSPCAHQIVPVLLLKNIASLESASSNPIQGLTDWILTKPEGNNVTTDIVNSVMSTLRTQIMLGDQVIGVWQQIRTLYRVTQYCGGVYLSTTCQSEKYRQALDSNQAASVVRRKVNSSLLKKLGRLIPTAAVIPPNNIMKSELQSTEVNNRTEDDTDHSSHDQMYTDAERQLLEAWADSNNSNFWSTSQAQSMLSRKRRAISNQIDLLPKMGDKCILQNLAQGALNAISYSIINQYPSDTTPHAVGNLSSGSESSHREFEGEQRESNVEWLSDSITPSACDLCQHGPNPTIDHKSILYSYILSGLRRTTESVKQTFDYYETGPTTENGFTYQLSKDTDHRVGLEILALIRSRPKSGYLRSKTHDIGITVCVQDKAGNIPGTPTKGCTSGFLASDKELADLSSIKERLVESPRPQKIVLVAEHRPYVRSPYNPRHKRAAPLEFVTNWFYRPVFGFATTSEIESIKSYLSDMKGSFDTFEARASEQLSFNTMVSSTLRELNKGIDEALGNITAQLEQTSKALVLLTSELQRVKVAGDINGILNSVQSNQLSLSLALDISRKVISSTQDFYKSTIREVADKRFNVYSFMGMTMAQLVSDLSAHLESHLMVPKEWSGRAYLEADELKLGTVNRSMITVFKIPVVRKSNNYTVYKLDTTPIQVQVGNESKVLSLRSTPEVAIIDTDNALMSHMSMGSYNHCRSQPGYLCQGQFVWLEIQRGNSCLSELAKPALEGGSLIQHCGADIIVSPSGSLVYCLPVNPSQWLLSVINGPLDGEYTCGNGGQFTQSISGVAIINLVDCDFSILNYRLMRVSQNVSDVVQLVLPQEFLVTGVNGILNRTLYHLPPLHLNLSLNSELEEAITKLDQVPTSSMDWVKLVNSRIENMDKAIKSFTQIKTLDPYIDTTPPKNPWSTMEWLTWGGIALILLSIITMVVVRCRSAMMPTGGAVLFSQVASGAAASIVGGTVTTDGGAVLNQTVVNVTWGVIKSSIDDWHPTFNIVMTVIMAILMLCHCSLVRKVLRNQHVMNKRHLVYPCDNKVKHHLGELPILMTMMVRFKSILGQVIEEQIGVSVATVPPPGSQYYISDTTNVRHSCSKTPQWLFPWSTLDLNMSWHNCCIKSRLYPSLDTCQSLPLTLNFKKSKILDQLDISLQFLWIKAEILGITGVYLSTSAGNIQLYSYTEA